MGLKILVVDDEFINRKLLSVVLKKKDGIEKIIEAENGEDAFRMLEKNPDIDFILLDIFMPKMDGVEFLKTRKEKELFTNIPVIVLSTDDTKRGDVLEEGANDFLLKPINEDSLFERIDYFSVI